MGLRDRLRRLAAGSSPLIVDDPRFDDWPVVRDFEALDTARANQQHLREITGIAGVLTADHPLDRYGRGDIALRVRPEDYGDAETVLSGWDL